MAVDFAIANIEVSPQVNTHRQSQAADVAVIDFRVPKDKRLSYIYGPLVNGGRFCDSKHRG
ncbi:MAG: hypothetical protein RR902_02085, partial [Oscillospiraceae bacterium]